MTERFTYDRLDRLTGVVEGTDTIGVFVYDDYGRMTSKRLHGAMVFDQALFEADGRPHAIRSARMYANPADLAMDYTSFDKLRLVEQGDRTLSYGYGYEHQRLRMVETDDHDTVRMKEYVGGCERVTEVDGNYSSTHWITFLGGPLGVFAVRDTRMQPPAKQMYYVHPDHLGSWTTVTSWNGNVVQDVWFDPWGTAYDLTTLTDPHPEADSLLFDRGFTGHEHLLGFGLINMNGRVYDPLTSSFLSVDNYVQDPSYTQNFNRYAYCMNNPLKYTDPDGEWVQLVIGALVGGIVNLATNIKNIKTFGEGLAYFGIGAGAGVVGALTGGAAAGAMKLGGFVSGAVSGAAGGASSGMIAGSGNAWMQGANFGQGLLAGAISAGFGAGTGALFGGLTRGFIDYRKGYGFWDGSKIDEFISGGSALDPVSSNYNSSTQAEINDQLLSERLFDEYNVKEGDYGIKKITTKVSKGYQITTNGRYVNADKGYEVGGYTRRFSSGFSEIHISPNYTSSSIVDFRAVAGHELIHAYHHNTILSYNSIYSERVAYKYTFDVYMKNYQYTKAFGVVNTILHTPMNFLLNSAPSYYLTHPFIP